MSRVARRLPWRVIVDGECWGRFSTLRAARERVAEARSGPDVDPEVDRPEDVRIVCQLRPEDR